MLVKSNILTMSFFLLEPGRSRFSHKKTLNSNLTLNLTKTCANVFSIIGEHLIFSSTRHLENEYTLWEVFHVLEHSTISFSLFTSYPMEISYFKTNSKGFGKVHNLKLYPTLSETPVKYFDWFTFLIKIYDNLVFILHFDVTNSCNKCISHDRLTNFDPSHKTMNIKAYETNQNQGKVWTLYN